MLITYILCWSRLSGSGPLVGLTSDVVFSSCHNHDELEPSPTGGVFERAQGKPNRKVPKRGKIVPRRGSFPNLVETAGYNLAQAFQEGYLITPHFWSLVHPQCTRKKNKKMDGWEEPREHGKRCRFWFGVDLTENTDVAVGEKICPSFCQYLGGCTPFCQMVILDCKHILHWITVTLRCIL